MALRAYVQSIDFPSDAEAHVVAVVTDDVRKQAVDLVVSSLEDLKQRLSVVLQKVTTLEGLRGVKVNDVIDLTQSGPAAIPGLSFFQAWSTLQSELAKVDAGVLSADDKRVVDARSLAASLDTAGYLVGRR